MKRVALLLLFALIAKVARSESWNVNANGNWGVAANWNPATVPNSVGDVAFFGSVITADRTITQNLAKVTLGQLTFSDDNNYTITGNPIVMDGVFSSLLGVFSTTAIGDDLITNDVQVNDSLNLNNSGAGLLTLSGAISGVGAISVHGGGRIRLAGANDNTQTGNVSVFDGTVELAKNITVDAIAGTLRVIGADARVNWLSSSQIKDSANVSVSDGGILDFNFNSEAVGTLDVGDTGRLFDVGILVINQLITNSGTISLSSPGSIGLSGPAVFDNFGRLNLAGGEVSTGILGRFNNYGLLDVTSGGRIFGGGFWTNFGLTSISSTLSLSSSGDTFNYGNIEITAPGQLSLSGSATIFNQGSILLSGGAIRGAGNVLHNSESSAIISGHGEISSLFSNEDGTVQPQGGTLRITNAFINSGIIRPVGGASLAGGAIANSGFITGDGAIANDIANNVAGRIEPSGLLVLGGGITNPAGMISAPANTRLIIIHGLPTNPSIISPSGGTIDNNGHPLINGGQISGYGTIFTGGLTNAGKITLVGGTSIIHGGVTNNAGKKIEIRYSDALFTGAVVNNGVFKTTGATATFTGTYTENGAFVSDPSNNYFADVFLNPPGQWSGGVGDNFFVKGILNWSGGGMIGDGATTYAQATSQLTGASDKTISGWTFQNDTPLTLSGAGAVQIGKNSLFRNRSLVDIQSDTGFKNTLGGNAIFSDSGILRKSAGIGASQLDSGVEYHSAGSVVDVQTGRITLAGPISIDAGKTLTKTGVGSLTIVGPQSHGVGATLATNAGATHLNSNANGNLLMSANGLGAVVNLNVDQKLASIAVGGGAVVRLRQSAGNPPYYAPGDKHVITDTLSIGGAGSRLDVNDGALVVNSNTAGIEALLKQGFGSGAWDGDGLTSSVAKNDPNGLTALGMLHNPDNSIYDHVSGAQFTSGGPGDPLPSAPDQVLIKYTYVGDTDLNGHVDGDDLVSLLVGYSNHLSGWEVGDFDYSGAVDGDDLVSLLVGYANQGAVLSARPNVVAVPEPSAIALALLGGLGFGVATRRRSVSRS